MATYNSGVKYNKRQNQGGARYNAVAYVVVFKLGEIIDISEDNYKLLAELILSDRLDLKYIFENYADYKFHGSLSFNDFEVKFSSLFLLAENIGMKDLLPKLVAGLFIKEKFGAIEELRQFADILAKEEIPFKEITDIEAFISALDDCGFNELVNLFATMPIYDRLNITDKEPKAAVSDFYVTKDPQGLYDLILPFNLIVDYSKTHIPFMPEAIDSTVSLSGTDGEVVQDTVYGSRIFDIFAVTMDGLEIWEKEEIKRDIAEILHSIKKGTKKLTFANNETAFDVKYSGLADIVTDAPSWMRFEIPLKSQSAYGHKLFDQTLEGSGLMVNSGNIPVGAVITISEGAVNPSFSIGKNEFSWEGTVPAGHKLVIDMDDQSCYLIDPNDKKTLATKNLKGEYVKIPQGSIVLQASKSTEPYISAIWKEQVLY